MPPTSPTTASPPASASVSAPPPPLSSLVLALDADIATAASSSSSRRPSSTTTAAAGGSPVEELLRALAAAREERAAVLARLGELRRGGGGGGGDGDGDGDGDAVGRAVELAETLERLGDEAAAARDEAAEAGRRLEPVVRRGEARRREAEEAEACAGAVRAARDAARLAGGSGAEDAEGAFAELARAFGAAEAAWPASLTTTTTTTSTPALKAWTRANLRISVERLRPLLEKELAKALKEAGWPASSPPPPLPKTRSPAQTRASRAFSRLVALQLMWHALEPELSAAEAHARSNRFRFEGGAGTSGGLFYRGQELVEPLWAIDVAARPLVVKFHFHFSTNVDTNRVDRPEWFVSFALQSLRDNSSVLRAVVDLADEPLCHSLLLSRGKFVDLASHLVRAMVLQTHRRLQSSWTTLASDSALLCHTLDEVLAGDRVLLGELAYAQSCTTRDEWPSMASFFTQADDRLEAWIQADYKFAKEKLEEVFASPSRWNPLRLGAGSDTARSFATESADRVLAMVDALGTRFETLASDRAKSAIVARVQCALLQEYCRRCTDESEPASFVARANSLQTVVDVLFEWSLLPRYVFFFTHHALTEAPADRVLDRTRMRALVSRAWTAASSSAASASSAAPLRSEAVSGGVFAPEIHLAKKQLQEAIDAELSRVQSAMRDAASPLRSKSWLVFPATNDALGGDGDGDAYAYAGEGDLSPESCAVLAVVKTALSSWERALHASVRRGVVMRLASEAQDLFWSSAIHGRVFSAAGAHQLARDVSALSAMFLPLDRRAATTLLPRLTDAAKLLSADASDLRVSVDTLTRRLGLTALSPGDVDALRKARRDVFL